MILPSSCILSSSVLNISRQPVASGGSGDIYQGTLDGSTVCVKRVRIYSKEGPEKTKKVCYRCHHLPLLLTSADFVPGGHSVETLGSSKHCPFPWYHAPSSPAYLGMDARRAPNGIHQWTPRRGPPRPCGCPSCHFYSPLTPAISYLTSLVACTTSTPVISFMAISKGYVIAPSLSCHRIDAPSAKYSCGWYRPRTNHGFWAC